MDLTSSKNWLLLILISFFGFSLQAQNCRFEKNEKDENGQMLKITSSRPLGSVEHNWFNVQMMQKGDQLFLQTIFTIETLKELELPRIKEGQILTFKLANGDLFKLASPATFRAENAVHSSRKGDGLGLKVRQYKIKAEYPLTQEQISTLTQQKIVRFRQKYNEKGEEKNFDATPQPRGQSALQGLIECLQ